jgi:phage-related minor tail protein
MSWFDENETRTVRVDADLSAMGRAVREVEAQLAALAAPAAESAAVLERAFDRSFDTLERQILRATRTGEFSFRGMVDAVIADLGRLAVQSFITQPLEGFFKGLFDFGGARAAGGPVAPGRSYLVGEQGPELFTPAGHGAIAPNGGGARAGVSITVHARDAQSFLRSEAQIAALVQRAVQRGARNS